MNRGHRQKPGQKIGDNPPRVGRIARRTVQPLAHRNSRNEAKAVVVLYVDAKKGDASVVPARRLPQLLLRQCPTDRPFGGTLRKWLPCVDSESGCLRLWKFRCPSDRYLPDNRQLSESPVPISAMTKYDRSRSQKRTANEQGDIGHKKRQQHQGEPAKHRCPMAHPFAVGENDEAERAEDNASDTVH